MLQLRSPGSWRAARRARTATKASASGLNSLVRVHDRLLKLEARVDLALQREASSAAAAAQAAAADGQSAAAADAVEAAEAAADRDMSWRVKDAVEGGFAAGWEARRGGSGAIRPVQAPTAAAAPPAPVAAAVAAAAVAPAAAAAVSVQTKPAPALEQTSRAPPTTTTTTVVVEFLVRCPQTSYGERVWLLGGPAALGKWSPARALRLRWAGDGRWQGLAEIEAAGSEAEVPHEFKALLRRDDDAPGRGGRWEARDRNRQLQLVVRGAAGGGKVEARASERTVVTVLPDDGGEGPSVRVEFDARF